MPLQKVKQSDNVEKLGERLDGGTTRKSRFHSATRSAFDAAQRSELRDFS